MQGLRHLCAPPSISCFRAMSARLHRSWPWSSRSSTQSTRCRPWSASRPPISRSSSPRLRSTSQRRRRTSTQHCPCLASKSATAPLQAPVPTRSWCRPHWQTILRLTTRCMPQPVSRQQLRPWCPGAAGMPWATSASTSPSLMTRLRRMSRPTAPSLRVPQQRRRC